MRKTARQVLEEVSELTGIGIKDIQGHRRHRAVAWPRQEACYEIYVQCPHMSMPAIGRLLGGRDHTTVLWGIKQHCLRLGVTYEEVKQGITAYRMRKPYVRDSRTPSSLGHYREASRYAV